MRKKFYLTLDTETATLPFASTLCKNEKQKQKIAIAKPLVYDIGWIVSDRKGNVVKKANYLVQETFFVPNVFNTAYYKDKRPIYMELYNAGEIAAENWNNIMEILIEDLKACDLAVAYNACFDFKKAIPFTEKYIGSLYSPYYCEWEQEQIKKCKKIIEGKDKDKEKNPDYLKPFLKLRGRWFPIADLWEIACERLINNDRYRDFCLENSLLTASAMYFSTSAEASYKYLMKDYDFIEKHTALDDAFVEMQILTKALKKGKVESQLGAFPFRKLGTTYDYVKEKRPKKKEVIRKAIEDYVESNGERIRYSPSYWGKILKIYEKLEEEK